MSKTLPEHLQLKDSYFTYPYGPHRGYRIGYFTYKRKDDRPISSEDMIAIKAQNMGQIQRVVPDGNTCLYRFEDDST
jgi:hypothetical protein